MVFGCLGLTACDGGTSLPSDGEQSHMFGDFQLGCGSDSCM